MTRVFVTRRIPEAGVDVLRREGVEVQVGQVDDERPVERSTVLDGVRRCDVLLPLLTEAVDGEVLEANPRLRGVANYAVGYDNVDVEAATSLGIPVSNTPGVLTDTTADLTWALLLAVARRLVEADRYAREGRYRIWGPNLLLGADVSPGGSGRRKVLGIVGFGRIGRAVAKRAVGFEMDVLVHDPYQRERIDAFGPPVRWAELHELLEASDFVTLHPLLTDETRHLIGEPELRRMKEDACLVNVSRGPVVDEGALVRALRGGWIGGAGLDVYEDEPEMAPGLAELPNAVLAPHVGSASRDTRDRMAVIAATNALHHLRGERAPDTVNPEVYEGNEWRARTSP
ncbi:MAG: D-glycerate dehydrogenase [Gemmatimonadota bacterium]|jgi:glyoxylate reductase